MENEVVGLIVREVLARIKTAAPARETGTLAIVGWHAAAPQIAADTLQKSFTGVKYAVLEPGFEASGIERLTGEELLQANLLSRTAGCENIVLVAPPLWLLSNIANGLDSGFVEYLALRSILWGKKVHVLLDFEIPRFKRNTFFEKLSDTASALTDMGVQIMHYGCFSRVQDEKLSLVTEKEVAEAHRQGADRIACAKGAIVTPAARDRAAELKIKIDR
jgi:hypothetical protein